MSQPPPFEPEEERLRDAARAFPYPPTPDIAGAVQRRLALESAPVRPGRLPWRQMGAATALLVALFCTGLLTVPGAQATMRDFLIRIGVITIRVATPTPMDATPSPGGASPTPTVLPPALQDLAGPVTLYYAQRSVPFALRLPRYPADLGEPDRVYLQDLGGKVVILVWLEPNQPDKVRLSLWLLDEDLMAEKTVNETTVLESTTVQGQKAAWVEGPHMLRIDIPDLGLNYDTRRLVMGNVLIWTADSVTYRLETTETLAEAQRIAESLATLPPLPSPPPLPPTPTVVPVPTRIPTPLPLPTLSGATTLEEARSQVVYPIPLPGYPADLGPPDRVYVQELGTKVTILVWLEPGRSDLARLVLYYVPDGAIAEKDVGDYKIVRKVPVRSYQAYWIEGPHMLRFYNADKHPEWANGRLIDGHTLVWSQGWLTYRLETALPLGEAIRIAESLR